MTGRAPFDRLIRVHSELTKWMDNAFLSKMKVPFYGKHPYEMSR